MHQQPPIHYVKLRPEYLHGPHHYANSHSNGLEPADEAQDQDRSRGCHEHGVDVSLTIHCSILSETNVLSQSYHCIGFKTDCILLSLFTYCRPNTQYRSGNLHRRAFHRYNCRLCSCPSPTLHFHAATLLLRRWNICYVPL